jgi:tRNA dimethylallyltransferase
VFGTFLLSATVALQVDINVIDIMENKLLVICGPTATGKTKLALRLAKTINGEIISSDSRQVYTGLDIGTGKDIPPHSKIMLRNSKFGGVYDFGGVLVWGYDLVDPQKEFSVAQYLKIIQKIIKNIQKKGKTPILVGGTGFYIKAVVDGIPTVAIPRNKKLRQKLADKKVEELFEILAQLDSAKAASMNLSDRKNSRRLVRAIEIAQWMIDRKSFYKPENALLKNQQFDVCFIGLTAPTDFLGQKIKKRVGERIRLGIEKEIKRLLALGVGWEKQALNSLGYRQWKDYFEGKMSKEEVIQKWIGDEIKYAKRQMTWFKKDKRIIWFDITKKNYEEEVEKRVKRWYS